MTAKTLLRLFVILLACRFSGMPESALNAAPPQELFDGQSLNGWNGSPSVWRVENGAIVGRPLQKGDDSQHALLVWDGDVHDFELTFDFKLMGVDSELSGVLVRAAIQADGTLSGPLLHLGDGSKFMGRISEVSGRGVLAERGTRVSIAPDGRRWIDPDPVQDPARIDALFQTDGWNSCRVRAGASHLEFWVNGTLCSVLDDHEHDAARYSGKLAFQVAPAANDAEVRIRDIRLISSGRSLVPPAVAAARGSSDEQRERRIEGGAEPERAAESPVLWHLRQNPSASPALVKNQAAQGVAAKLMLPYGFEAKLVAAEPDIHQPIAFAFDERGRIWVAEAHSYPNKQPTGAGQDRIVILADEDGDGEFETRTVFIEGLNLVSGLEVGFGGVWVGAAPELLFIPDANQDDIPDGPATILLDGWGYQDTHETLNSFTWGPDGWLYGNQGVFTKSVIGKPGAAPEERLALQAGVWRYHPVRHEFEVFAHGGSNQWGLDFNSVGHLFMTHCRSFFGGGGTTYVIRNGHFWNQANLNYAPFIANASPEFAPHLKNYLPAAAKYDSGEGGAGKRGTGAVYGGHSHVGTMIYLGGQWPEIYHDHLFTHNLHGHQINHQVNDQDGSGYETRPGGADMLFAPDAAYVAVDLQYGPDGAVYFSDWCDTQHCHSPHSEIWDRTNGRLYRMAWKETYQPVQANLSEMSDLQLADLHRHRNEWFVRTARRVLQHRAATAPLESLAIQSLQQQFDAATNPVDALRALWTMHVTGLLSNDTLAKSLQHGEPVVRAWGVQLATEQAAARRVPDAVLLDMARGDSSPVVRLALTSAAPVLDPETRWELVETLSQIDSDADDRFLPKMIWFALASVIDQDWDRAYAIADRTSMKTLSESILWQSARSPEGRERFVEKVRRSNSPNDAVRLLKLLATSMPGGRRIARPQAWNEELLRQIQDVGHEESLRIVDQLSALFGDASVLARKRALALDTASPIEERKAATLLLRDVRDPDALSVYEQLFDDDAFRSEMIPLLRPTRNVDVLSKLVRLLPDMNEADRQAALNVLTSRAEPAVILLQAVEVGEIDRKMITALHVRQLRDLPEEEVQSRLLPLWGKANEASADVKARIEHLKKAYQEAPLWAFHEQGGRKVFEKNCASCHPLDGKGAQLGPDISAAWRNGAAYFIENIVDPNAVVGEAYQLTVVARTDGTIVSGVIEQQSDSSLTIRTIKDSVVIPVSEIDDIRKSDQSFMPSGILDSLTDVEIIELLKFLTARR